MVTASARIWGIGQLFLAARVGVPGVRSTRPATGGTMTSYTQKAMRPRKRMNKASATAAISPV
jgi:hypothetical protein